jgi:Zn-dependent M28 family amino/carboxypeptidase
VPGPPGSDAIEALFADFHAARGLAFEPEALGAVSDYAPFADAGIPVGGVFAGSTGIKSAEQAAIYVGTAGLAYDPCYHVACDTFDNVSLEVLDLNADAIAYAVLSYAMNAAP